jgi:ABC-type nitrate/sulfonate/bicarbonate transport system permease component
MLRPISPIAWIPVAILLFGVGDGTAVFLIFLAAVFPIVVACISGVPPCRLFTGEQAAISDFRRRSFC